MPGHALVIGSQTHGLTGAHEDAERVAQALKALGLEVDLRVGGEATRDGILQGYRQLIGACAPGEAAFIYYAGHGAQSQGSGGQFQFIVPADYDCSKEEDFRGITSLELSGLLAELTERTRNVTVVLDCCFAARMSRGADLVPRALPEVPHRVVRRHVEGVYRTGTVTPVPHIESNPHAVRLAACAVDEAAYEYTNAQGLRTGVLTDAFLEVLREARGLRVSWGQVGRRVREGVLARCPQQRPELLGPARRLLFQLEELEQDQALAYYPEHNRHWLRGGRLHGVHVGNEYMVMPLGSLGPGTGQALALAQVVAVQGGSCQVELKQMKVRTLPTGAPAFLVRSAQPRRAVALEGAWEASNPLYPHLRQEFERSYLLRPVAEGEQEPTVARLRLGSHEVDVLDHAGDRVVHPLAATPGGVSEALRTVEVLARAQELRALESSEGAGWILENLKVEWGKVIEGEARRLATAGQTLHSGERLYVQLSNNGSLRLYVSIFDIGVSGSITLLSTSEPSGLLLEPRWEKRLGAGWDGVLVGLEVDWPDAVPREGARPESLVLIASDRPVDLRLYETSRQRLVRGEPSSLEQLLQGTWGTRAGTAPGGGSSPLRYAVKHIRFWLDPHPR
jgi:hypothetical protein